MKSVLLTIIAAAGVAAGAGLCSCSNIEKVAWAHFTEISPEGWEKLPAVVFEPDSAVRVGEMYDVLLSVRYYRHRCQEQLRLRYEQESLNDSCTPSELTLTLLNKEGKATGRGSYGIYEITDTVIHNLRMPAGWSLAVTPLQRSTGVTDVGVTIVKSY